MRRWLNANVLYPALQSAAGRRILPRLRQLRRWWRLDDAERAAWQHRRLAKVVADAGRFVPYYRDLFAEIGFDPSVVARDPGRLGELPYLDRHILAREGRRMLDERFADARLFRRDSGGSLTRPSTVWYDTAGLDFTAAVVRMCNETVGLGPAVASVSVIHGERPGRLNAVKHRLRSMAQNKRLIRVARLDADGLDAIWARLRGFEKSVVLGRPSMFAILAAHLRQRGIDPSGVVPLIETTGETLDAPTRELAERTFGARIIDRYGQAEFGVMAYQLPGSPLDSLRVLDTVVVPETLRLPDGRDELVCTGLLNPAMPLIRYRTADMVSLRREGESAWLDGPITRVTDAFELGGRLWTRERLRGMLDAAGPVALFQVDLHVPGPPALRVLPGPDAPADLAARIDRAAGGLFDVRIVDAPQFTRAGWGNKFVPVVPPTAASDPTAMEP